MTLGVFIWPASSANAANASLSTSTVNIAAGENGTWTISGNDDGNEREFRWSLPSGLNISTGSSSNLNRFRVRSDRGYLQVESDGRGSFSGTVNVSSSSSGTYTMQNTRAEISLSPRDITVNIGGSDGGGSAPPPDTGGGGSGSADYTLYIEDGFITINGDGGAVIDAWGYTDANGSPPMVPGPVIEATQGQTLTVEVVNNHNRSHNFVIQGVTTDTGSIAAGSSKTYTFTPDKGGVFFYRDTLSSNVNREMGMHGALIVRSNSNNRVWDNGPSYDIERLWVLTDMDVPNWNDRASAGQSVNTATYRPNYFMINGQGGFDGMHDPNTILEGNVGDVGVVRIVNAGQFDQSLHWHGNHFQVISRNGNHLNNFEWQDTINVKGGETMMVLYQLRDGIFPMHVHTAQMETANGVYLNGTATLIVGN
jgi:FtsP/CotA-like multicopper oxidase with cupredoxin domain